MYEGTNIVLNLWKKYFNDIYGLFDKSLYDQINIKGMKRLH